MPVIGTKDGSGGGWVTASGNNNGGVALGINHDHVQDAGSRNMSSGVPIVDFADDFGGTIGSKIVSNTGTGAATTDRVGVEKAVSAGTLAFTPTTTGTRSEEFVMMGVSTKLGGVANTHLKRGGVNRTKSVGYWDKFIAGEKQGVGRPRKKAA